MAALIVKTNPAPIDLTPAQILKLKTTARARGCDALLIHLDPPSGCEVTVLWSEVGP
jgi:hypothetical protein